MPFDKLKLFYEIDFIKILHLSNAILTEIPRNTQLQLFLYVLGSLEDNDTIEGKRLLTDTILGSNWRQKKNRF